MPLLLSVSADNWNCAIVFFFGRLWEINYIISITVLFCFFIHSPAFRSSRECLRNPRSVACSPAGTYSPMGISPMGAALTPTQTVHFQTVKKRCLSGRWLNLHDFRINNILLIQLLYGQFLQETTPEWGLDGRVGLGGIVAGSVF